MALITDDTLKYFENELVYLRQMSRDFAQKYPIASRLQMDINGSHDPHVERLIESFAYIASRIHQRLDDEYPLITEAFLNALYPHYLSPMPSMSIAGLKLDPSQGKITTGYTVEKGTTLYTKKAKGLSCKFRTVYPVVLWPLTIKSAVYKSDAPTNAEGKWDRAEIRLSMVCHEGVRLCELSCKSETTTQPLDSLTFYITGDSKYLLYETIFTKCVEIEVISKNSSDSSNLSELNKKSIKLPLKCLRQVGYERDQELLEYTKHSFSGYRLISEYFSFPEKFLFFQIVGLSDIINNNDQDILEIVLHVRNALPSRSPITESTFYLGATPIINLFEKNAEPIHLNHLSFEYRVIPDLSHSDYEIHSIKDIQTTDRLTRKIKSIPKLYTNRSVASNRQEGLHWYATRKKSSRKNDNSTDLYLSFAHLGNNQDNSFLYTSDLSIRALCTNSDLPSNLQIEFGEEIFEIELNCPLLPAKCLHKPTATYRPELGQNLMWKLISHLTLNHVTISNLSGDNSADALREILSTYDYLNSDASRNNIQGISALSTIRVARQISTPNGLTVARGIETTVHFDEQMFVGSGVYLFASILERFFALYVTVNSFNEMVAVSKQRGAIIKRWPPRNGEMNLL